MEPVQILPGAADGAGGVVSAAGRATDVDTAGAFEALFENERQPMLLLALRLVDRPERAEEIVQDAFRRRSPPGRASASRARTCARLS